MPATALKSPDRISCCQPTCRRRPKARKNWCATPRSSPPGGRRQGKGGDPAAQKQFRFSSDQGVAAVFLTGRPGRARPGGGGNPAEPLQKLAALPPVQQLKPQNDSVNAPIAMFSRH